MTRILVSFSILFLLSGSLFAQQWAWINRAGSSNVNNPGLDHCHSVRTDNIGNIYVAYWFNYPTNQDTVDSHFDGYPLVNPYLVGQTHIAKYASDGHLLWAKNLVNFIDEQSGPIDYFRPYSMELDSFGHIYIAGVMDVDSMLFNGDTISNSTSADEGFVMRCDTALNQDWLIFTNNFSASGGCTMYDMALDERGNIFVAGSVIGSIAFGSDTLIEPSNALSNLFAKIDSIGNVIWITSYHAGTSMQEPHLALESSGNIILANNFINNIYYGNDSLLQVGSHAAILRVDSSLTFISWQLLPQMEVEGVACVDTSIYLCGRFYGTIALPIGTFTGNSNDGFLTKLNLSGTYNWFTHLNIPGSDRFTSLSVLSDGAVVAGGEYKQTFSWNAISFAPSSPHEDMLVVKVDSDGIMKWIATGGGFGFDYLFELTSDSEDHVFVCGKVGSNDNIFGNLNTPILAGGDAVVARINSFPCMAACAPILSVSDTAICFGDSILLYADSSLVNIFWTNGFNTDSLWWQSEGPVAYYGVDSSGCYRESDEVFVELEPDVDITGGSGHHCVGTTVMLRPFTPSAYLSFVWSDGSTNDTAFVTSNGSYWLTATDTNGCIGNSDTITLVYSDPVAHFRDSMYCAGEPTFFFDSSYCNLPGETINWWHWDFFPGSALTQNTTNIYSGAGTFNVELIVRNNYYCYDTLNTTIDIMAAPNSSIILSNDTLFSPVVTNNQWLLNGQPVSGANDSFYVFTQNGDYSVVNTNSCGSDTSNIIIIDVSMNETEHSSGWLLFPNPCEDFIHIKTQTPDSNIVRVRIIDNTGRVVQTSNINKVQLIEGHNLKFEFREIGIFVIEIENHYFKFIRL